jgi:hypothetical protein
VAAAVNTGRSPVSPSANLSNVTGAGAQLAPKMNPVAQEITVIASGARPSQKTGERELFTEETTTALVFENGGVLRLVAAVVPGQLLFLTNKATNREVVAQVTRKRDFTAMSCYVEVEFTEAAPEFWGIEFPKVPQAAPANSRQAEVVKQVQAAKVIADKPATATPTPSASEVNALKQELETLRKQLEVLQTQKTVANSTAPVAPAPTPPIATTPSVPNATALSAASALPSVPAPAANVSSLQVSVPAQASNPPPSFSSETEQHSAGTVPAPALASAAVAAASSSSGHGVLPIDYAEPGLASTEIRTRPAGEFRKPRQAARPVAAVERSKKVARSGSGSSRIILLAAALLFVVAGTAWYMGMIPGMPPLRNFSASVVPANNIARPVSATSIAPVKPSSASAVSNAVAPAATSSTVAPPPKAASKPTAQLPAAQETKSSVTADSEVAVKGEPEPSGDLQKASISTTTEKRSTATALSKAAMVSAVPSGKEPGIVPPRLIKSVRAMASPDMLQDFASGNSDNVTIDAVVDPTGHVKAMKPLSGPASLHSAAMDALRQYQYEPATQHGKPVAAHVTVTIKFVFEP